MKQKRQEAILNIITSQEVETQEELLDLLAKQGFIATQATISRDIRELSLVKELGPEGQCYRVATGSKPQEGLPQFLQEGLVSVASAQNIVVVKTLPGLAMAACTAFDEMKILGNLGTLAGDDTCILIMADLEKAEDFVKKMEENR